jgi:hypothetical protein
MEPEGSLPCSQEPSTGPYPELDQSAHITQFYLSRCILILFTHLRLGHPSDIFPSTNPINILIFPCHILVSHRIGDI